MVERAGGGGALHHSGTVVRLPTWAPNTSWVIIIGYGLCGSDLPSFVSVVEVLSSLEPRSCECNTGMTPNNPAVPISLLLSVLFHLSMRPILVPHTTTNHHTPPHTTHHTPTTTTRTARTTRGPATTNDKTSDEERLVVTTDHCEFDFSFSPCRCRRLSIPIKKR
jgi:hypothetical protein